MCCKASLSAMKSAREIVCIIIIIIIFKKEALSSATGEGRHIEGRMDVRTAVGG